MKKFAIALLAIFAVSIVYAEQENEQLYINSDSIYVDANGI